MKKIILFLSVIILISPSLFSINPETEPNDTFGTANTFALNDTISGSIGISGDSEDWFIITTELDGELKFIARPASTINTFIYLYDNDGTTFLRGSANSATGENDTLIYSNLKAGKYYIRMTQAGPGGSYTVENTFTATSIPDGNDSEPNDTFEEAVTLNPDTTVTGHIGFYGNLLTDKTDWYKITTLYDGKITFIAKPESTLDPFLYFYDTDGAHLIKWGNVTTVGENDTLIYDRLKQGTYYLRFGQTGYGSYTLESIFTPTSFHEGNDSEPNDTYEEAVVLNPDTTVTGHLGFYGNLLTDEMDWYKITTTTDGDMTFVVIPESTLDPFLYFYDTDGTSYLGTCTVCGDVGENDTLLYENLTAGTYYMKIGQNGFGSYSFRANSEGALTSIETVELKQLRVYPNPFRDQIILRSDVDIKQISIYNLLGKQLIFENAFIGNEYVLNTSYLKNGIYILSVEDINGIRKTHRIIKQ